MNSDLVLGFDLGTSYLKVGMFDRNGVLAGLERLPLDRSVDDGVHCEVDPGRFRALLQQGVAGACQRAGADPGRIAGVSYSSQANTFLLLDDSAAPLTPVVLWPDRRAAGEIDPDITAFRQTPEFLGTTGLGVSGPLFAVAKCRWFQRHRPELWTRTRYVMTLSDYLAFCLSGGRAGDMGTAALLGILDLQNGQWWREALDLFGLSEEQLSTPLRPGTVAGTTTAEAADRLGVPAGVPVAIGGLDHHVAAVGAGAGRVADLSVSIGTVLACLHGTHSYNPKARCCIGPGLDAGSFYELAFSNNGAASMEWYREQFAPDHALAELDALAACVPPGSEGLAAPVEAYRQGGLDSFTGRSPTHGHGHFVRALMESTAASLAELLDTLCGPGRPGRMVATGGGARSAVWPQLMADMLDREFVTTACDEPACLGAALLAAVAAGWFADIGSAATAWISVKQTFSPRAEEHAVYADWLRKAGR